MHGQTLPLGEAPDAGSVVRPRGHNLRWAIIGVITLLTVTNYLDRGNLSVAAPLIERDLGVDNTAMGIVLSAFIWPYALMNLPTGWLIDRFGARALITIAAALWSVIATLTGFMRGISGFVALRVGLGISEAPLFPGALKATNAWFPDHERAAATSVYIAATQVGLAIAPPIATALMLAFGWPAMFIIMGLFGFAALALWLAIYREPDDHARVHPEELAYIRAGQRRRAAAARPPAERVSAAEWMGLFRYGSIWTMIVGGFCLQYVFWFYIAWLPTYLERTHHFTIHRAGLVAAAPFVAGAVAVLLGGTVSDMLVRRGVEAFTARRVTITAGALLTAAAMIATAFSTNAGLAVVLLTIGMFTYSLSSAPYWALATDVVQTPRLVASVGSIQNFGGFFGGACAPIVTGIIVDRSGSFLLAILLTGVLALVSAVMYGIVLRRRLPV